ncbi:MAG: glycosyltransferase [Anaerolineae bacterium]|nr:glycosyltransferase [Anaerolineae bacterium]
MKIISFVEGANPKYGGVGIFSAPIINMHLSERGHDVRVVIGGAITPGYEKYRINSLDQEPSPERASQGSFGIVAFPALGRWSFSPSLIRHVKKEAQKADFLMLHSLYSYPVLTGYWLAKINQIPYGLWLHGVLAPFQRAVGKHKKFIYDRLFARSILNHASVLLFTAAGEKEETSGLNLKAPSTIIPLGFEPSNLVGQKGEFRKKYLADFQGDFILFLARINAKKGLELLISAFAQVLNQKPETLLVIAGGDDPPEYGHKIRKMAAKNGYGKSVIFTGLLLGQDKENAFTDATLYVLPSHAENFGFSIFEAMSKGLPVIISNSINYAQEIERRGAGILVPLDEHILASEILQLLNNPAKRRMMGENGKKLVAQFAWQRSAKSLEDAICRVLRKEPIPPNYYELP